MYPPFLSRIPFHFDPEAIHAMLPRVYFVAAWAHRMVELALPDGLESGCTHQVGENGLKLPIPGQLAQNAFGRVSV